MNCRPPLSSVTSGFDNVPVVTDAVASTRSLPVWNWTPVSQRNALTSGTPGPGARSPTSKLNSLLPLLWLMPVGTGSVTTTPCATALPVFLTTML